MVMDDRATDLLAENIDVALHLGALTDSALSARKLAQAERVAVASRAYLVRSGTPRVPTDLHEHAAILYVQNSGGEEWSFRHRRSQTAVRSRGSVKFTAAEGCAPL
jgi:LysR substrate binding domain